MFDNLKNFYQYNHSHRKEVLRIEKQCLGYNTFLTRFHDIDKLIMAFLFIPNKWISKIHRYLSWHHPNNKIGWFRLNEAIFDWESARFTKPDKPLNARQTCLKFYPQFQKQVLEKCDKWGI